MLYRILENKMSSDGTSDFIPQYSDTDDEKFDQNGQVIFRGFYERGLYNLHTIIKFSTLNEAQAFITAEKRSKEMPSEVIIHTVE
jgi:hypothetical protein